MPDDDKTQFLSDLFDQAQNFVNESTSRLSDQIKSLEGQYGEPEFFAQGGMKLIYKVRDLKGDRTVAMARLPKDADEAQTENFLREARLTSKLQHPNIIPVHDIGIDEKGPYFTMKFLEGKTLEEIITGLINDAPGYVKRYQLPELLRIFQYVCNAVAYAHSKGVIHLDLKPANIHVSKYGEVTLCDWGLAKILDEKVTDESFDKYSLDFLDLKNQTIHGYVKGTPGFLAPEQIKAVNQKDKRTDIYALGAILYNMLTLKKVIDESDSEAYKKKLFENDIQKPIEINPQIPPGLNAVILKCLSIKAEERYQDIEELISDINAFSGGFATKAEDADALTLFKLMVNRNKEIFYVIILFLIILAATLSFYLVRLTKEETAKIQNYEKLIAEEKLRLNVSEESAKQHYQEAKRLYEDGKLESALLNLTAATNLCPEMFPNDDLLRKCLLASGDFKKLNSLDYKDEISQWIKKQRKYDMAFFSSLFKKLKGSEDKKLYRITQQNVHKNFFGGITDQRSYLQLLLKIDNPEITKLNLGYNGKLLTLADNVNLHDIEAVNALFFTDLNLSNSTVENIDNVNYKQLNSLNLSNSKISGLPNWTHVTLNYLDVSYCLFNDFKNIQNYSVNTINCRGIYIPLTEVFNNEAILKVMVSNDITIPYSESSNTTISTKTLKYEEYPETSMMGIRYAQFVNMDHNRDKVLSSYEFLLSPKLFASWDFNNDGMIQISEIMQSPRPIPQAAESPLNYVKVGDIEIMDTEVTNNQFCKFLNENKEIFHNSNGVYLNNKLVYFYYKSVTEYESKISFNDNEFTAKKGYENYPVNFVTFYGASAFAEFHKGRLMTRSDWDLLKDKNATRYLTSTGRAKERVSNFFSYLFHLRTHMPLPVKFYPPAQIGIYDLTGNLREWSSELSSTATTETAKVYGGSFLTIPEMALPARAQSLSTQYCDAQTGFRIVKK